jgi:nicotinamide-nucleotide amidase
MQEIINKIHDLLIKKKKTIAVAESCTGGLLSVLLTQVSGSSQYFTLGITTYSNNTKVAILKVPHGVILRKGAVSKDVAYRMAQSVRKLAKTDFGIGITGIAGPTGGTPQKPIGTVFIAINSKNEKKCNKYIFKGGRKTIRKQAALKSLELLKKLL